MNARRAVIDTNVLVSAFIRPDGPPGQVVQALRSGALIPVVNDDLLAEYEEVLSRPKLCLKAAAVQALLHDLRSIGFADAPAHGPEPAGLPDPSDWPFMALARAAQCPVITGNVRHFPAVLGMRVMTPREWLEELVRR